tara:strand:+ start:3210 stop:3446 length:237 start_codon:yes stop_codon:yes gene_type:complete
MSKYKDKSAYLSQIADREWPEHVIKAFTNCKTKVRHAVSKVVIEGNASDSIVKEILDWMGESQPIVIQKERKNDKINK